MTYRFAFGRPPAVAAGGMVATSQPLATRAGLRALERGGNAADAALAGAAVLCVAEPMSTGIGGDCFAQVWADGRIEGLDAAGPAPAVADRVTKVDEKGRGRSPSPGRSRAGRRSPSGTAGSGSPPASETRSTLPRAGSRSRRSRPTRGGGTAARSGSRPRSETWSASPSSAPRCAGSRRQGPSAFYSGEVAEAICSVTWLEEADLASYEPRWVEPLRLAYKGVEVCELPPPTQGVCALEALGLLERSSPGLAAKIRCVQLALEDALARVRDGADVSDLISPAFLDARRGRAAVGEPRGGTVYLCAVDGDGMAVSFIQSLYDSFGSGIVAPRTGVVLQNRGACFSVSGAVDPGRRPYHTIIPGMLLRDGELLGPFGVMGGFIQAQAHMQLVSAIVDDGLDPQAALDRPRFRVERDCVRLEEGLWEHEPDLRRLGYATVREPDASCFGGGQAILVVGDALVGGSDPRKDGYAGGI